MRGLRRWIRVFGNLKNNKGLYRFTRRGLSPVDGQWKLQGMVHDIEKMANQDYGMAFGMKPSDINHIMNTCSSLQQDCQRQH